MREEAALKYEKFKLRSPMIGIHPILDKNKTNREVVVRLPGGEQERVIGHSSKELHLAILLKNKEFRDMDIYEPASGLKKENIDNIKQEVYSFLGDLLEDNNLREHQLYSEIEWIHKKR
jgi:hypothetical protein